MATQHLPNETQPQTHGGEGKPDESGETQDRGGAERYPSVRQDDSVEAPQAAGEDRSFDGETADPDPRRGGGQAPDPSVNQGGMDRDGDPDEGKR